MRNHRTVCWNTREALIAKADFHIFFLQPIHIHYHDIRRPPCGAGPRDTQKAIRLFVGRVPAPLSPPPTTTTKNIGNAPVVLFFFFSSTVFTFGCEHRQRDRKKKKREREREKEKEKEKEEKELIVRSKRNKKENQEEPFCARTLFSSIIFSTKANPR